MTFGDVIKFMGMAHSDGDDGDDREGSEVDFVGDG